MVPQVWLFYRLMIYLLEAHVGLLITRHLRYIYLEFTYASACTVWGH